MSYQAAAALQAAIFARLSGYAGLAGVGVFDALPPTDSPETLVLIGPEVVIDQSDVSGAGAEHRFDVAVISSAAGFQAAKTIAGAVSAALVDAPLMLAGADLVSIGFLRASARRTPDGMTRRIDMTFRARIAL